MKIPQVKGTTLVVLNKEWAIRIDNMGNYTPIQFVKKHIMEVGTNKGKVVPSGWVVLDKYFGSVYFACKWIVEQGLLDHKLIGLEEYKEAHLTGLRHLSEDFKKASGEIPFGVSAKAGAE